VGGYAAYHPEVSSDDGRGMQRSIYMRKPGDGPLTADPVTLSPTMKRHKPPDEPQRTANRRMEQEVKPCLPIDRSEIVFLPQWHNGGLSRR
jgi:hypothetical protein